MAGVELPVSAVAASMVVGAVALMILGVQPVLLGALTQSHRLTEAQLGPLATAEMLALAIGSAIGAGWLRAGRMRLKTVALSLVLTLANLGTCFARTAFELDTLRGLAGLTEGLMMGATIVITIQHRRPDRLNAIFLAVATAPQAALAYLLPVWIMPQWGVGGGFAVLTVLSLVSAGAALLLVDRVPPPSPEGSGSPVWTPAIFVAVAAVILQYAAIGGAWGYIQVLSDQRHFAPRIAGIAVSGGLVMQVAGALVVAAWGQRLPLRGTLVLATVCQTAVIVLLAIADTPLAFIAPAFGFGLFWLAISPFQIRLLINVDPTRSVALVLTAVTLAGLSIGPSIAALGVHGQDVTGAYWICAALMMLSAGLYGILGLRTAARI